MSLVASTRFTHVRCVSVTPSTMRRPRRAHQKGVGAAGMVSSMRSRPRSRPASSMLRSIMYARVANQGAGDRREHAACRKAGHDSTWWRRRASTRRHGERHLPRGRPEGARGLPEGRPRLHVVEAAGVDSPARRAAPPARATGGSTRPAGRQATTPRGGGGGSRNLPGRQTNRALAARSRAWRPG